MIVVVVVLVVVVRIVAVEGKVIENIVELQQQYNMMTWRDKYKN